MKKNRKIAKKKADDTFSKADDTFSTPPQPSYAIAFSIILLVFVIVLDIGLHFYHLPSTTAQAQLNLSSLPSGVIIDINYGIPNQPETLYYTYIATSPYEQALGFTNQTSFGYGNMLFLFKNDTLHCLSNKNIGTNMTLYWFNTTSGGFVSINKINTLQAYNTTPVCDISNAVLESINGDMPEIITWG